MFITTKDKPFYFWVEDGYIHWPEGEYLFPDGDIKTIESGKHKIGNDDTYFLCYGGETGIDGPTKMYDSAMSIPSYMNCVLAVVYESDYNLNVCLLENAEEVVPDSELIKPKTKWKYPPGA